MTNRKDQVAMEHNVERSALIIKKMGVVTYTRAAKCKDCKFIKSFYDGKNKKHTCTNPESKKHTAVITQNDLVCEVWKLA